MLVQYTDNYLEDMEYFIPLLLSFIWILEPKGKDPYDQKVGQRRV
jgi:hypothetical protein